MKYFVIDKERNPIYPLLGYGDVETSRTLVRDEYANPAFIARFVLGPITPKNPILVDCHFAPDIAISSKIKEVIEQFDLWGVQFLRAEIQTPKQIYTDYWALKILTTISCVDREKSNFDADDDGHGIDMYDKLVLDESVLKQVPEEQRLLFRLEESYSVCLFEKSLVDMILKVKPKGLRFIPVDQWNTFIR